MKFFSIFIICFLLVLPFTSYPATTIQPLNTNTDPPAEVYKKLASLKISEIQKLIGRKLTLKEKISFVILKHTTGKQAQSKKGNTALIFGIVGVGLLLIGLFVPFVILGAIAGAIVAIVLGSGAKKQDQSDQKARAAVLLGWITLGATALLLIIATIVVLSGAWLL